MKRQRLGRLHPPCQRLPAPASDGPQLPSIGSSGQSDELHALRVALDEAQARLAASRAELASERHLADLFHAALARHPGVSAARATAGAPPPRPSDPGGSPRSRHSGLKHPPRGFAKKLTAVFSRRRRKLDRQAAEIASSGFFDAAWYGERYPDIASAGMDPLYHFVLHGASEQRDPGPHFNSAAYLVTYPDVVSLGLNPLLHYLRHGRSEGREVMPAAPVAVAPATTPPAGNALGSFNQKQALALLRGSDLFDGAWYLAQNPDVAQADIDPMLHYLLFGGHEGRDPGPRFNSLAYLQRSPDIAASGMNPLLHHLNATQSERSAPASEQASEPPCETGRFEARFEAPDMPRSWRTVPPKPAEGTCLFGFADVLFGIGAPHAEALARLRSYAGLAARLAHGEPASFWQMDSGGDRRAWDAAPSAPRPAAADIFAFASADAPRLADAWFVTTRDLRVRLETPDGGCAPGLITCLQIRPEACEPVYSETAVGASGVSFLDVATASPFLPLLFVLTDPAGTVRGATLLPFPSLCRGGLHHAEALAAAGAPGALDAVRATSAARLAAWVESGESAALDWIEADLAAATGAERLFGPDFADWLSGVHGIGLRARPPAEAPEPLGTAWLREAMRRRARRSGERTLHVPADGVPSLHALFHTASEGAGDAPFLLCDGADGRALWLIAPPPGVGFPAAMQPCGVNPFPRFAGVPRTGTSGHAAALRFAAPVARARVELQAPVALEQPVGRLVPGARTAASLTVLLCHRGDEAVTAALLAALALQIEVGPLQVILLADMADAVPALTLLRRHFPTTGHLMVGAADEPLSARFARAGALAQADLLTILGEDVLLHDPRTLASLAALFAAPDVASASCMLIANGSGAKIEDLELVGCGAYVRRQPEPRRNFSDLALEQSLVVLPPATWPVAANTLSLAVVRRTDWAAHGGFTAVDDRLSTGFWAGSAAAGRLHLVTTAVSATMVAQDRGVALAEPPPPGGGLSARRIVA